MKWRRKMGGGGTVRESKLSKMEIFRLKEIKAVFLNFLSLKELLIRLKVPLSS